MDKRDNLTSPKISVLMGVYNSEKFLRESINSILNQSFKDFEFLIINDGSTDSSSEIIESYKDKRIRFIENEENIGLTKSLNKGLNLAKGMYIARQDADDVSDKTRFEKQIAFLEKNPSYLLVGSQAEIINESGWGITPPFGWEKPLTSEEIKWWNMFDSPFIHSAILMKKDIILNKYNGYNPSFRTSQDFELWSRIVFENKCANLNEVLLKFRAHTNSLSANYSQSSLEGTVKIIESSFIRGTGKKAPDGFSNTWMNLLNFNFGNNQINVKNLIHSIDLIYQDFCIHNQIGLNNNSLLKQKNILLLRVFFSLRNTDKKNAIKFIFHTSLRDFKLIKMILSFIVLRLQNKMNLGVAK